ncbi:MAG: hypothetical protein MUF71_21430 [Candidatus Kapabacteria bacterium]|jgi:hypothetical protein|nr:hypothetical protein [Candidatus Kapabacteria bacterium]
MNRFQRFSAFLLFLFAFSVGTLIMMTRTQLYAQGSDMYGTGIRIKLNDDGTRYIRFLTWHQIWFRYLQNNPNSYINEAATPTSFDIGIRRSRFLLHTQIDKDFMVLLHLGINNQTNSTGGIGAPGTPVDPNASAKKPQVFMHDVYGELRVAGGNTPTDNSLYWGFGMHYWVGLSRMSMSSTLNYMANDSPILCWPTIEATDQFVRMIGTYIKGKALGFDYTFAFDMPFRFGINNGFTSLVADPNRPTSNYSPNQITGELKGYIAYEFWEKENRALPFTVGTYLGSKKVLNVGVGFQYQPNGMWTHRFNQQTRRYDTSNTDYRVLSADFFMDLPLQSGKDPDAITAYAVYYNYAMGPNYIRNIGIMNPVTSVRATPDSPNSFSGGGNSHPLIGTGHGGYAELGYVFPGRVKLLPEGIFSNTRIQPYIAATYGNYEALNQPFILPEAGFNWLLEGHHARLNFHYRGRPVYDLQRNFRETRPEFLMQAQVYL